MSEYDNSWVLKSTAGAFIGKDNLSKAQTNTQNVFADMINTFFVQFKMTITRVPMYAISAAKKLKNCKDIKANPTPFSYIPKEDDFKKNNNWILAAIGDRLKAAV